MFFKQKKVGAMEKVFGEHTMETRKRERRTYPVKSGFLGPEAGESVGTSLVQSQRIGFLRGNIRVPDDFDSMGQKEIEGLFGEFQ